MNRVTFITATIGRETLARACNSVYAIPGDTYHIVAGDGLMPNVPETLVREIIECPHYRHESDVRNEAMQLVETPWVAFLDDDDTVDEGYVEFLEDEISKHDPGVVIFRQTVAVAMQHHGDAIIPARPEIVWGNVGISYACKTEWALRFPFKRSRHEDLLHLVALEAAGAKIVFSDHIAYYGRDHR